MSSPSPPSVTQRSALRVTVPTLTDTPPVHSFIAERFSSLTCQKLHPYGWNAFLFTSPSTAAYMHIHTHEHTHTYRDTELMDDPLFACMPAYITFIRLWLQYRVQHSIFYTLPAVCLCVCMHLSAIVMHYLKNYLQSSPKSESEYCS